MIPTLIIKNEKLFVVFTADGLQSKKHRKMKKR